MAKQSGPIPFKGKIGGISFYIDKVHGGLARTPGGPSKSQFKRRPSMQANRDNCSEFSKGSHFGKLIRRGLTSVITDCKEGTMNARLAGLLRNIISADKLNLRGERILRTENLQKLFNEVELNAAAPFSRFVQKLRIKESDEQLCVSCTNVSPADVKGATHWKVMSAVCEITGEDTCSDVKATDYIPTLTAKKRLVFEHKLPVSEFSFYGISISYYVLRDGKYVLLEKINDVSDMKAGVIRFIGTAD